MEPKVTIITAVYNGGGHLEKTILSVLSLRHRNVEYIIIDGGSTDGTLQVIDKYKHEIRYWISEPDYGVYDAMNKGWLKADLNSFVLFLGSGDILYSLPDANTLQLVDVAYGRVKISETTTFKSTADFRLKLGNTLHHQALLVRKSLHPGAPFSLEYKIYSDFDFNQRLLKKHVRFHFTPEFVAYAMPGGISSQFNYRESLKIVKRNYGITYQVIAGMYYALLHLKWNYIKRSNG